MTRGIVKRYFCLLGKVPLFLILYSICVILSDVISLGIPILSSRIIDMITLENINGAYQTIILLGVFYLIQNTLLYGNNYFYASFFKNCYVDLHRKLIESIYQYDMKEQSDLPKAKIINTSNLDLISICEIPSHVFHIAMEYLKLLFITIIFMRQDMILGIVVSMLHFTYLRRLNWINQKALIQIT